MPILKREGVMEGGRGKAEESLLDLEEEVEEEQDCCAELPQDGSRGL